MAARPLVLFLTRGSHATPVGFAAHQRDRSMEDGIAVDMLNNKVDVRSAVVYDYLVPQDVNKKDSATMPRWCR